MRTTATLLVLTITAASARAEGLLYRLPPDGSWARFDTEEVSTAAQGRERSSTGFLFLRCVGRETVDGDPCRWIEIEYERVEGGVKHSRLFKLLLSEKHLKRGAAPLDHFVRGWYRQSIDGREKLYHLTPSNPTEARLAKMAGAFLAGPMKDVEKLEAEVVESKLGALECQGESGRIETDDGEFTTKGDFRVRLHDKAPFGVVAMDTTITVKRNGRFWGRAETSLKLADFGENAVSALADQN